MVNYHLLCYWDASPGLPGWDPTRCQWRGIHPPGESVWGPWMHRTQWGAGTSDKGRGAPLIRLLVTQTCHRNPKESLITSQRDILVTAILGVKPCFSGSGSSMELRCCMRVYENASWDAAQLWTEWGIPSRSVSVFPSGNGRRNVEIRVKTLPCSVWLITLKGDLMKTELTPNKLKVLCEVHWPAFGVGWPLEGSLDKTVINEVYRVIVN
jgi:hypothetical protein